MTRPSAGTLFLRQAGGVSRWDDRPGGAAGEPLPDPTATPHETPPQAGVAPAARAWGWRGPGSGDATELLETAAPATPTTPNRRAGAIHARRRLASSTHGSGAAGRSYLDKQEF